MAKKNKRFKLTEKNFNTAKSMLAGSNTLKNISLSIGCSPAVISRIRGVKTFHQYKTEQKAWHVANTPKRADLFKKHFQKLENVLEFNKHGKNCTSIMEKVYAIAKKDIYIENNKEIIKSIKNLRNILSHKEEGKYIVQINNNIIKKLKCIIKKIEKPPTVISIFKAKIYEADVNEDIHKVMKKMWDKTYTHVPVRKNGEIIGVFSYTSLFSWLADNLTNNLIPQFLKKIMGDINRKYLKSPTVNYKFIKEKENIYTIPNWFTDGVKRGQRKDCLLITKNANPKEKISGIITSWDLATIK